MWLPSKCGLKVAFKLKQTNAHKHTKRKKLKSSHSKVAKWTDNLENIKIE